MLVQRIVSAIVDAVEQWAHASTVEAVIDRLSDQACATLNLTLR